MLTDFQKRKLTRYFDFYDADNNGFIERNDYIRSAERLARARGWAEGTAGYEMVMGRFNTEWEVLKIFADDSHDERVSLDEWFAYHNHILMLGPKNRLGENDIVSTIFETLDFNGDGHITENEFQLFYSIYGMDAQTASEIFHKIDENGDGILTRNEIARLYHQFAHSNNPDDLGNWLFGHF